jgi:hypothetical protein
MPSPVIFGRYYARFFFSEPMTEFLRDQLLIKQARNVNAIGGSNNHERLANAFRCHDNKIKYFKKNGWTDKIARSTIVVRLLRKVSCAFFARFLMQSKGACLAIPGRDKCRILPESHCVIVINIAECCRLGRRDSVEAFQQIFRNCERCLAKPSL